jgi:hypothetical protein
VRTRHLCSIPIASLDASTALLREITGNAEEPPVFKLDLARGPDRANARLYAHVWLWTEDQTLEFVRRLPEIGGTAMQTYPIIKDVLPEVEKIGPIRRPDLERLTIAQIRERAEEEGVDLRSVTRKSDLIDRFEEARNVE